jgi:hypothetical protein
MLERSEASGGEMREPLPLVKGDCPPEAEERDLAMCHSRESGNPAAGTRCSSLPRLKWTWYVDGLWDEKSFESANVLVSLKYLLNVNGAIACREFQANHRRNIFPMKYEQMTAWIFYIEMPALVKWRRCSPRDTYRQAAFTILLLQQRIR